MNLANKITMSRIILSIVIMILLLFPFGDLGMELPSYLVGGKVLVELKYIVAGVLFVIASLTDFLDGYIARKYNLVTDFGKLVDAIADKVLVNSVLIILAAQGFIHPIIPVVVILRDTVVNSIKGNQSVVSAATSVVNAASSFAGIVKKDKKSKKTK